MTGEEAVETGHASNPRKKSKYRARRREEAGRERRKCYQSFQMK
jgi:hypothetical protein